MYGVVVAAVYEVYEVSAGGSVKDARLVEKLASVYSPGP